MEDSIYLQDLREEMPVAMMDTRYSYLFIRCFHGQNTWERKHFFERLHYTFIDKLYYFKAKFINRDIFTHPAFQLTAQELASRKQFLQDSRELQLLCN